MLIFSRSSMAAVAAGIAISLSGCSDYPGDGRIDTKMLRSEAAIIEAEGHVYGVRPGGIVAYVAFESDRRALESAVYRAWEAHQNGEDTPPLELQFTDSDFDLADFKSSINEAIAATESQMNTKIAESVAEAQEQRDQLTEKLEDVSQGGAKFESYVAQTKTKYEEAQKALNDAIDTYNAEIESPLNKINELAEANNLDKVSPHRNPIRSYRTISFRNRTVPSSCPNQRGYTTVDLRAEQKLCAYIRIPSGFNQFADEIASVTKTAMINIPKMQAKIGEKRSWGNEASGAYAERDNAKEEYENRVTEARKKYGDNRQRERKQDYLHNQIERIDSKLANLQSDDHRSYVAQMTSPSLPDSAREALGQHIDAAYKNLLSHIEKGPAVTLGEKDAVFSDLDDGYEGAVIVTDFIYERRGHRNNGVSVLFVDLTDEAIKNADQIVVDLTKYSFRKGRGVDIDDQQEVEEALVELLDDVADERAKAGNV